jgi:hypothetical protein
MLQINVRVPVDRSHTALVEIRSGMRPIAMGFAAASASSDIAAKHGNAPCDPLRPWGHVPAGGYQLIASGPAPKGCEGEYGKHLLAFQPISGAALDAESYGRLTLLAYAGPVDRNGQLRRTQGGLRLDPKVMDALVKGLASVPEVLLQIAPERPAAWWQFWKVAVPAIPLSPEPPRFSVPPLDEASLAAALSAGKRRARPVAPQSDDRDWDDRDRSSSSSSSSSGDREYAGRGGGYGGAGASGSWDNASPSGAGRGVDASGRIATGAAAVAAAAALDAAAQGGGDSGRAGGVDTSSGTSY